MKTFPANSYDLPSMRRELIKRLTANLKPDSKYYAEDYENVCYSVNRRTRKALLDGLARTASIAATTDAEIKKHCQI